MTQAQKIKHPGELLAEVYLKPRGMSAKALAEAMGIPSNRVSDIIRGRRRISADTAIRLSQVFDTPARTWLSWQADYDLWLAGGL